MPDQARATADTATQAELFTQAESAILGDIPLIPLVHTQGVVLASTAIRNIQIVPGTPSLRIAEWKLDG